MGISKKVANSIAEEELLQKAMDDFFTNRRTIEAVDVVFTVLAVVVVAALFWGAVVGAFR